MTLSDATHAAADRLIARYPQPRSALLPLLYLVQAEEGSVTAEGITFCAEKLDLTRAEVQAVSTFYEMFEREDPGDWLVTACVNFSCKVRGGQRIFERWVDELGGHHDVDTKVTVKHLECLGNCDGAPVVQVNYQNYERLSEDEAVELLAAVRRGQPPTPVSGEAPPTFREVCRRLAGLEDADRIHAAAVRAAQSDLASYEQPPAQRVLSEPHDLGGPGVADGGPVVGDAADVQDAADHDVAAPSDQPPAGERLDGPVREPSPEDAEEQIPTSEEEPVDPDAAPEGGDGDDDGDGASATDEGDAGAEGPSGAAEVTLSGGTSHVRRLDTDPGSDAAHAPDPTPRDEIAVDEADDKGGGG